MESYLQRSLTAHELAVLEAVIASVSDYISTYLGREYVNIDGSTPTATTRLFNGSGLPEIYIDDFTSISEIKLLDIEGNDYLELTDTYLQFHPLNSSIHESVFTSEIRFPKRLGNVSVTGVFTSGSLPDPVISTASILVGLYLAEMRDHDTNIKKESIEGYSYERLSPSDYVAKKTMYLSSLDIYQKKML